MTLMTPPRTTTRPSWRACTRCGAAAPRSWRLGWRCCLLATRTR
jgi:hypothetical protein